MRIRFASCSAIAARACFLAIVAMAKIEARDYNLPQPQFAERPRALYTAAELAEWKADPTRTNDLAAALRKADIILEQHVTPVPKKEGQWIFYYACPKDNANLQPETPEKHICPVCKSVYEDERTIAAYRTVLNNAMEYEIAALALAYALSNETKYAVPVRKTLLDLAALYPTWDCHDRWGRRGLLALTGGRRYSQLLDEAVALISLAYTYDLTANAPCFSREDKKTIEDGLFRFLVKEIQGRELFVGSRNNHQTWFNAAYAVAGLVLADKGILEQALAGKTGLLWQLEASVTSDGLWYEGTFSYHFYALQAIKVTLEAAARAGIDFSGNTTLKSLWLGPVALAWPNGNLPVLNDGDPCSLALYNDLYGWGAKYFKDPALAAIGEKNAASNLPTASAALTGIGAAVLRRAAGSNAVCAMLDYGEHGGHHGHPDKLNLMLYAHGREFILDPGRLSYSVPEYETWCRTTLAHNTALVNGCNQAPEPGELIFFTNTAAFAACLAAADRIYPAWDLKRFLLLTDDLLVDCFAVCGKREAEIDWIVHARGKPEPEAQGVPLNAPIAKGPGYEHLRNVINLKPPAPPCFGFSQGNERVLRIYLPGHEADQIFVGTGIGYSLKDEVPFLLRRRRATSTMFATVYDLASQNPASLQISILPVMDGDAKLPCFDAVGLQVQTPNGVRLFGLDMRRGDARKPTLQGIPFDRVLLEHQAGQKP